MRYNSNIPRGCHRDTPVLPPGSRGASPVYPGAPRDTRGRQNARPGGIHVAVLMRARPGGIHVAIFMRARHRRTPYAQPCFGKDVARMTPEDPPDAQRRFREGAPGVPRVDILEKVTVKKIVFLMRIFWAWNRGGRGRGGNFLTASRHYFEFCMPFLFSARFT